MGKRTGGSKIVLCLSTVAKKKDADRIARYAVKNRLAACVNIVPGLVSHYRWKGKIFRETELLLLFKTTQASLSRLERELVKLHPYDLPEFVVFPMNEGSKPYLRWIAENVLN